MYSIFIFRNNVKYDISEVAENLAWGDSVDTLGMSFTFSIPNKILYSNDFRVNVGDKLLVINSKTKSEVFRGIVTSKSIDKHTSDINALDYAFYLNQSKTLIQFKKATATDAIKQLLSKFDIPIYSIADIPTKVTKIYSGETIAEIINDILAQATKERGTKYRFEMYAGKVYIEKYQNLTVKGAIQLASNLGAIDLVDTISSITATESIDEMKNSVIVAKDNKILATAQDSKNIQSFGLLQEVVSADDGNPAKARTIANNTLKELNIIQKEISIEALADDTIRAGRLIELNEPSMGLIGNYLIKSCNHSYTNNNHRVSLTLGVI